MNPWWSIGNLDDSCSKSPTIESSPVAALICMADKIHDSLDCHDKPRPHIPLVLSFGVDFSISCEGGALRRTRPGKLSALRECGGSV